MQQVASIFIAQFTMIALLGFQSQHIRDGKKLAAAITSLLLGIAGYIVTGLVSEAYQQGLLSWAFFAFICAGPCGITTSIWLHEKLHKPIVLKEK